LERLKVTRLPAFRNELLAKQGGKCAICQLPCSTGQAVLDHDHSTGAIRATLHRGCNALLGKIENNHKRYGVPNLSACLQGVGKYIQRHSTNVTGMLHPTFKTDDEKRLARNAKARALRAAAASKKESK